MDNHTHSAGKRFLPGCEGCKALQRAANKRFSSANPEYAKRRNNKQTHGWTLEERDEFVKAHGSKCNICGRKDSGRGTGDFHIDHDHACCPAGRSCVKCRRGLLCHPCNTALGLFQDSPAILQAAIDYLRKAGA